MTFTRTLHGAAAAVACALLTAPAALAQTTTTPAPGGEDTPLNHEAPVKTVEHGAGNGGIVRTIVGLAVVIGVIYGLHWILKQVKSGREERSTGGGLSPLSTLQLGPGRALHLVRSGSEIVLVGTAEHGVTPIRVYSEDEALALGLLDEPGSTGDQGDGAGDPMNAAPGSPPVLRELLKVVQRWTVRR